jgi:hypothetical protein
VTPGHCPTFRVSGHYGIVMVLVMVAGALDWCMSISRIPQSLASAIVATIHEPLVFVFAANVILLVIGCFMEGCLGFLWARNNLNTSKLHVRLVRLTIPRKMMLLSTAHLRMRSSTARAGCINGALDRWLKGEDFNLGLPKIAALPEGSTHLFGALCLDR